MLWVASECSPFARQGALGDAVAGMVAALRGRGVDARVVLPRYGHLSLVSLDGMSRHLAPLGVPLGDGEAWCAVYEALLPGTDAPVYMLDHEVLFDRPYLYDPPGGTAHDNLARFAFLSRGALQLVRHLGWIPDVMHAHDWPSALVPLYLGTLERRGMLGRVASAFTLHDVAQQGRFSRSEFAVTQLGDEALAAVDDGGAVNLLRGAIRHADALTVLSPSYRAAVLTPEGGAGLDDALRAREAELVALRDDGDEGWDAAAARLVEVYGRARSARRA